jgi:hypothetical protein
MYIRDNRVVAGCTSLEMQITKEIAGYVQEISRVFTNQNEEHFHSKLNKVGS